LVDNVLKNSKAYAFIDCTMGLVVFLISPWFLEWPGWSLFVFNILVGAIFAIALWLLYEALRRGEASRILVIIGGVTPVFSIILSLIFFKEHFSFNQWIGIIFLFFGVIVITLLPKHRSYLSRIFHKLKIIQEPKTNGLLIALLCAFAYSIYFIGTKYAYLEQPFLSAFIWNRLGAGILVLLFLLNKTNREAIVKNFKKSGPKKNKFLVIVNQFIGSSGFLLQSYAIFLGSVALVNALQGVQYAFLLIISAILAVMAPKLLKETFSFKIVAQKTLAVLLIATGLYFLTIF
jgi:drug/metabolite transporter (DMT)-like permease